MSLLKNLQKPLVGCLLFFAAFGLSSSVRAASLDEVTSGLTQDIQQAQRALDRESRDIEKQRDALAQTLDRESQRLRTLRDRVASVRRQSDERTLTLSGLEDRIQGWRNQDAYRNNLLRDFAQRNTQLTMTPVDGGSEGSDAAPSFTVLQDALVQLEENLEPQFTAAEALNQGGEVTTVQALSLGPVHWFVNGENAGLLTKQNSTLRVAHTFAASDAQALFSVQNEATALLPFDPTIDRLLQTRVQTGGLVAHVAKGGVWVFPIIAFAVIALLIGIAKTIQLARLPKLVPLLPHVLAKDSQALQSLQGAQLEVVKIAQSTTDSERRDDLLFSFLTSQRVQLEKFLGAIAVTATVSPLLGLLGTVSGMITTFDMMTLFGAGDPAVVSGGISQALITTELGLVVAIPALVLHALLSRRVNTYTQGLEASAVSLVQNHNSQAMNQGSPA
ncbi:MAG: MotA/TolQ/ExbB proton channel family protein [Pseudomonadota bacterium]